jgi:outer membrane protein TolC
MKIKSLIAGFCLIITTHAHGQSIQEYLTIAAENSPTVKAKYFEYLAALQKTPQAVALPDPQLSFSFFMMPMERYMGNQIGSVALMQMFPWFGTREAAKDESILMAKAKFEELIEAKTVIHYEVRVNWYALILIEQEIAITEENLELLESIEQIAINRFTVSGQTGNTVNPGKTGTSSQTVGGTGSAMAGMGIQVLPSGGKQQAGISPPMGGMETMSSSGGTMIDAMRIRIEIRELENTLENLKADRKVIVARFNYLLNRESQEPVTLPETLPLVALPAAIESIPDSIRNNNPMLKMLAEEDAAYLAQGRMNQKMGLPMIGIGLQYEIMSPREGSESTMNGRNALMPMATITIPLWRKKNTASVRESEFLRQSVIEKKQEVSNQLMVGYEDVMKDFQNAQRRAILYQEQASYVNQILEILIVQYTTEGSSFEEVLRVQKQLLDYRLRHSEALIDGHIAVAMIERLMGR